MRKSLYALLVGTTLFNCSKSNNAEKTQVVAEGRMAEATELSPSAPADKKDSSKLEMGAAGAGSSSHSGMGGADAAVAAADPKAEAPRAMPAKPATVTSDGWGTKGKKADDGI